MMLKRILNGDWVDAQGKFLSESEKEKLRPKLKKYVDTRYGDNGIEGFIKRVTLFCIDFKGIKEITNFKN
ncbi:hypothetical protein [Streptococcus acidominimus]|uniref:Uncharacterized protein n=1 Tax=Streptococcus acidominimus TaxID=1326 RepID=A0A1Q8EBA6_STRAI|nr:hypothetical protein [Streptococcus acidominimus]OLF49079.1 hypothetical protein BU200_09310 [Streptococcus acidominimus]SUN06826.1 Uncharacterised protein [Streptococcus acidominimus]